MQDPRLEKLAHVLVSYSTEVRQGDLVRLVGPPLARPLIVALYRAVLEAGGHPHMRVLPDECAELKLEYGSPEQLEFEDPLDLYAVERIDVSIGIWADENTKEVGQ